MVARQSVLIVEDEEDILEVLQYNLSREGYRVISASEGETGLRKARTESPDLILLDLMLPRLSGVEVCRRLRHDPATRDIPVIMVTARAEESDVVLGLGIGADDYISKPFSPRELVARVQAVLRRGPAREDMDSDRVEIGDFFIDRSRHEVSVGKEKISLTATELRLTHLLASHPGHVFTRDQILTRVVGEKTLAVERNIDAHVKSIRKKLGKHRHLIETVRGVGYRFGEHAP